MRCLIVLAKAPVPGAVKTRLCPPLSPWEAARVAEAFLLDALEQYATLKVDVRLYLSGAWTYGNELLCGASIFQQGEGSLGDRLSHACRESEAHGYRKLIVIGADHPTLPTAWIAEAIERLEAPGGAVIGPTTDGGFYLLGMHPFAPVAFAGEFSHARVFEETYERLVLGWKHVDVLRPWYDVDSAADLDRLRHDLLAVRGCKRTREVLGVGELQI